MGIGQKAVCIEWSMKRKNDPSELILLSLGILLLLLLFGVKRRLDAPSKITKSTAEMTENGIKTEKREDSTEAAMKKMEQENAVFLQNKGEKEKETSEEPMRIRVLLTDCGKRGYAQAQISLRGNTGLTMNDGGYIAKPQETVCITEKECGELLRVIPEDENAGTAVSLTGKEEDATIYPGSFEIYQREDGLLIVNELDLETYLRYVVPSEMPSSYEKEALKAQAVCARTYAYAAISEKAWEAYHADVDDSVESQVYHNVEAQPETDAAVAETEGKIITCGGKPIQAYFFSTSCGKTSTDEVWNTAQAADYLKSVTVGEEKLEPETEEAFASFIKKRDSTSLEAEDGWYRWQVTLPADVLSERAAAQKIGEITKIEVLQRSEGGAAETVRIEGTKGSMEIDGEYQIRKFLSVKECPIQKNDGTVSREMELLPSACFTVVPEKEGETVTAFVFYGGGYGHGVGMSQNGAQHLAEQGKTYEEILAYFYQNIEINDCRSLF